MQKDQKKILNALNVALSSNVEGLLKITSLFPEPERAYKITKEDLKSLNFREETVLNFLKKRQEIDIEKEWQEVEKQNIKTIAKDEKEYPSLLKEIAKPPALLYLKGNLEKNEKYLSCVGTRWPSDYGKMATQDIVSDLSNTNFTIVSGLARGIDTLSHKTALENNQRTIAVLGTGFDFMFPPENKNLAQRVEKNGALISEFPLGTPPLQYNFPLRNRIIAGLSLGTLVIEAKKRSGALITANFALEEGREVFALPGSIYSKTSEGCNILIKQGAHPITSSENVLSVFNIKEGIGDKKEITGKTNQETLILKSLKQNPKTIDEIIKATKLKASLVSSALILLEIEKKVKRSGEKYYLNFS